VARRGCLEALWRWRGDGPGAGRAALSIDERLDGLADLVARHVDVGRVRAIAGLGPR